MTLIEAYVFRNTRAAFMAGLFVLTSVIWITQALREFDLLTTKGQSFVMFIGVTSLGIPSLVAIIAPVALFIAILYTLNRLNNDSELVVMSAAGISTARLFRPFVVLTVITTLIVGAMSIYAMPWSFFELRTLITKIRADFITHVVREGTFTTLDDGFIFHYRDRAPDGALRAILMEDRRDPAHITSYLAESGQIFQADDNSYLVLTHGSVQRHQPDSRDAAIVGFDRYALDLAQFGSEGAGIPLRPRERSTRDLLFLNRSDPNVKAFEGRFRSELHDRLVSPLFALSFAMVAFAALGEPRTTRQGRGTAMMVAVISVLLLRVAGFGASSLVVKSAVFVPLYYAVPLIGLVGGALYAFAPRLAFSPTRPAFVASPHPA